MDTRTAEQRQAWECRRGTRQKRRGQKISSYLDTVSAVHEDDMSNRPKASARHLLRESPLLPDPGTATTEPERPAYTEPTKMPAPFTEESLAERTRRAPKEPAGLERLDFNDATAADGDDAARQTSKQSSPAVQYGT